MKKIIFIFTLLSFACSENSDTLFSTIIKKKHLVSKQNITKRYDYVIEEGKIKIEKIKEYIEKIEHHMPHNL